MTSHFEIAGLVGFGFGYCIYLFLNGYAIYKAVKRCQKIWIHILVVNIIAGILLIPLAISTVVPIAYFIINRGGKGKIYFKFKNWFKTLKKNLF
jgi:hypothetical protein